MHTSCLMIETWLWHLTKISSRQFRKAMNPHTEFLVPSTIHCWSFIQPLSHCPVCTPSSGMRSSLTSSVSQGHPPRVLVGRSSLVVASPLQPRCPQTASRKMPVSPSSCIQLFHPWHRGLRPRSTWSKRVLPSRLSIEENGEWGFTSIGSECRQGCITSYLDLITTLKSRKWKWIMATRSTKGLHYYATIHLAHAPLSKAVRLLCDHRARLLVLFQYSRVGLHQDNSWHPPRLSGSSKVRMLLPNCTVLENQIRKVCVIQPTKYVSYFLDSLLSSASLWTGERGIHKGPWISHKFREDAPWIGRICADCVFWVCIFAKQTTKESPNRNKLSWALN